MLVDNFKISVVFNIDKIYIDFDSSINVLF